MKKKVVAAMVIIIVFLILAVGVYFVGENFYNLRESRSYLIFSAQSM